MKVCSFCNRCYGDEAEVCIEEGHPLLSETRSGTPETIAGYRLELLLESGSKCDTYLARQTECGRSCRIKIVNTEDGDEFLREAKLAAGIFHANLADVYEAGTLQSGEVFVVSENAENQTLRERLDSGHRIDLLTSILIVRQTAEALHALHLKGLIHRALRPENVVLAADASEGLLVKVQNPDFGGSTQGSIVSNKFFIDSALDSLRYFAPEQCCGEEISAQTDVYSLGIVFYEMLAGAVPFDAPKAAGLIEKHKTEAPPAIKINNFDLRMLVTHSLMESLQKQPRFRQSSANALARQLRHIEQLANHISTPPPIGIVPPAPARSKPRISVSIDASTSATTAPVVTRETPVTVRAEFAPPREEPVTTAFDFEGEELIKEFVPATERGLFGDEPAEQPAPPRRSRMKVQRKRTHSKILAAVFELQGKAPEYVVRPPAEQPKIEIMSERADTAMLHPEPKRIEWVQPDDDIPSVDDVMEIVRLERSAALPVLQPEPAVPVEEAWGKEIVDVSTEVDEIVKDDTRVAEAPVEIAVPVAMLKSELDVNEEETAEATYAARVKIPPRQRRPQTQPIPITVDLEEQEEITLVRAHGTQIRIDLDRPLPWKKWSLGGEQTPGFFPTILGDGKHGAIDPDTRDSMFADYYNTPRTKLLTGRRVAAIGAPLALVVMFLFGNDLVTKYLQARSSDESAAVKAETTLESPPAASRAKTGKKSVRRNFKEPENEALVTRPPSRNTEKPAPAREATQVKSKSRTTETKSATTLTPVTTAKPAALTRPRVVREPGT